jgi:curved DNA-binding protein CbpA
MDDEHRAAFELLGIAVTSDQDVVNRAFRRLARTVHPDVSADPEAARRRSASSGTGGVTRRG